jgi:hypothetical protein
MEKCVLFRPPNNDLTVSMCEKVCKADVDKATAAGQTASWGCIGYWPDATKIPWERASGTSYDVAPGKCLCNNPLIIQIAEDVIKALPAIAEVTPIQR